MLWPYIAVIFAYMAPFPDMVKAGVGQRGDWRLSKRSSVDVSRAVERRRLEAEAKSSLRVLMDVTRPLTTFKLKRIQEPQTIIRHWSLMQDAVKHDRMGSMMHDISVTSGPWRAADWPSSAVPTASQMHHTEEYPADGRCRAES